MENRYATSISNTGASQPKRYADTDTGGEREYHDRAKQMVFADTSMVSVGLIVFLRLPRLNRSGHFQEQSDSALSLLQDGRRLHLLQTF
jgi:hypothetical protein